MSSHDLQAISAPPSHVRSASLASSASIRKSRRSSSSATGGAAKTLNIVINAAIDASRQIQIMSSSPGPQKGHDPQRQITRRVPSPTFPFVPAFSFLSLLRPFLETSSDLSRWNSHTFATFIKPGEGRGPGFLQGARAARHLRLSLTHRFLFHGRPSERRIPVLLDQAARGL